MKMILSSFIATFIAVQTFAQIQVPNWDVRLRELQSYDSYASRLRDSDGAWRSPKPAIIAVLRRLAPHIRQAAERYHVDPRAIAGAVLAENSLNVQADDDIQDWLVSSGVLATGQIGNRAMTIGLGQINVPAAHAVETLAAGIEGRPRRSDAEIAQALLRPADAILYAAAILREAQDAYTAQGFNLSNQPGLLTTIYNLGQPTRRAAEARAHNRQPRINYFGFFVEHYLHEIASIVRPPATPVAAPAAQTTPVAVQTATPPPATTNAPVANTPSTPATPAPALQTVSTREIRLSISPSTCSTSGAGRASEYNRIDTFNTYASAGSIPAGQRLTAVTPGLGCNLEAYTLVQAENGTIGWVTDDILRARSTQRLLPPRTCRSVATPACQTEVAAILGTHRIATNQATNRAANPDGQMTSHFVGQGQGLSWHRPFVNQYNYNSNSQQSETTRLTPAQA